MKRMLFLFSIALLSATSCAVLLGNMAGTGIEPVQAAQRQATPDDENLKSMLRQEFMVDHDVDVETEDRSIWSEGVRFKKNTNITDERFHAALMAIYREAEAAIEAESPEAQSMQTEKEAERWLRGAVFWLGTCEDVASRAFLLDLTADTSKDDILRIIAFASYIRVADAQETRDILLRHLVGVDRMDSQARSSIVEHAHTAYREAELGKKRAIIEALYVSLASEDAKWLFRVYDRILTQISPQYASSEQRRDILKRLIQAKPTCKADEYAMEGLQNMLRSLEETTPHTSINTNLAVLRERDFSQPSSADESIALEIPPDTPAIVGTAQETVSRGAHKGIYAVTAVAGLLAAFALWRSLRRKRGSA